MHCIQNNETDCNIRHLLYSPLLLCSSLLCWHCACAVRDRASVRGLRYYYYGFVYLSMPNLLQNDNGVEGEGLYKAVELQCQTCPSCAIHRHDTKRKQGYTTPMHIPMEPMDSIALDVFHYPSTSHDEEVYD